ncbi:MAG: glycoside hydrolase family 57 protein [bacterium]|nr:glycoside hydrolase family 57 protein [bacterium]
MVGINFLWHMHQPDYRPAGSERAILPWVRLHAVRGYLDMLSCLRAHPQMRCTVNFSGILLDQLLLYSKQPRDYFAELSLRDAGSLSPAEAGFVVANFFSANVDQLIRPHDRYRELYEKRERMLAEQTWEQRAAQFDAQELTDLLVWFNLAWIGFTGRKRSDVQELMQSGRGFNLADQQQVIAIHDELVAQVLPGYRAQVGTIELSFTPQHHPILPLLHDLAGVGTAVEGDALPWFSHPQDAAQHVRRGMQRFGDAFGKGPQGAWPAEGSVSNAALTTLADAGVRWAATDQQNHEQGELAHLTPRIWQSDGREVLMFFRDTRLSDSIGFEYARWDPGDAVKDLIENITALGLQAQHEEPVVSIVLDGENPWENYADGGEAFLHGLFAALERHEVLQTVTPSELLGQSWPVLESIRSGSWIGGNFDIWTKDAEARRAWCLLAQARRDLDDVAQSSVLDELLTAEASDWFWWYGGTFESDQKLQFDELFRGHLIAAYELARREVPAEMREPIG